MMYMPKLGQLHTQVMSVLLACNASPGDKLAHVPVLPPSVWMLEWKLRPGSGDLLGVQEADNMCNNQRWY